jgi:ferredoxin-thioredoxin reductase catalytic chain
MEKETVQNRYNTLKKEAEERGYRFNPDHELAMSLVQGLVANSLRYGEEFCPCRLVRGEKQDNLDIVCPCDYRDQDIAEYGSCFCGLYVSPEVEEGGGPEKQTPERRPSLEERRAKAQKGNAGELKGLAYPVWRCKVCGYLCANPQAPKVCPICKAKQERFEKFI